MPGIWDSQDTSTKIKICDINSINSSYELAMLGIDALGFHILKEDDIEKKCSIYTMFMQYLESTNVTKVLVYQNL